MKLKDEEKEIKIKEVTLDLVNEQGIAGVKMAAIAKRAGLSPSTLYVYYKSKDELLKAIFKDTILLLLKSEFGVEDENTPYKARIEKLYKRMLGFKKNRAKENHFMKQFFTSPYFDEEIRGEMQEFGGSIKQLLQFGRDQMILKDNIDINIIMATIDGITEKLVEYGAKGKIELNSQTIDEAFQVVWDGIKQ